MRFALLVVLGCTSASKDRPAMIMYEADWCAACRVLERTTLADPGVRAESARFTVSRIDASDHVPAGVTALPTIMLVDSSGDVTACLVGIVGVDQLRGVMHRVH